MKGRKGRAADKGADGREYGYGAQRTLFGVVSYLAYFVAVAAIATISILSYELILKAHGGVAAATATAVILVVLSVVLAVIAAGMRKARAEQPVKNILLATEKITRGDFEVYLKPRHAWGRYDEYDIIAENINRMAAELSKTEMLRSDFIANVSHEIKTPLSVIQSYAGALMSEKDEQKRGEYAATLAAASKRLTLLVSDILKLNKLENQKIFPEKKTLEAGEVLRGCVLSYVDKIDEKGINLDCDIEDFTMSADEGFLEIIFNNLLSNAVKFTENGGNIAVSLKKTGGYAQFAVRDDGCGMSAETGAHIFDKFYQGDTSHSQEGNGLGLALVKRVIDICGGEINVNSRVGGGSCFTVRLAVS